MTDNSHGNRRSDNASRRKPNADTQPIVRKVPAGSVLYGDSISRNGRTVWAAYSIEGVLIGVAATVDEARSKYRAFIARQEREKRVRGENLEP